MILEAQGVTKRFDRNIALRNVDFELARGECVVLRGANGAGKSTLLSCLCGALRPDRGSVRFLGEKSARNIRRGIMLQKTLLYAQLTIEENLQLAACLLGIEKSASVDHLLERFHLQDSRRKCLSHCSPGVQRKASFIRAVLGEPDILFLDEPNGSLDHHGRTVVDEMLAEIQHRGTSIVVVLHDSCLLPHREVLLESGKIARAHG